ncbi:RagB/SusD family nutrient uptake outer membrane protein [Chitinophaga lutea]|nr:RagB/SusD family nutrient uptake outer membrane protein [Chitinophaga lutea]
MKRLFFTVSIFFFVGCNKLLDIDIPQDRLSKDLVFSSDASVSSASSGLYSTINFNDVYLPYIGLYVDEILPNTSAAEALVYSSSIIPSNNTFVYSLWKKLYAGIYQANVIIENVPDNLLLSDTVRARAEGEARFVRAFQYFHLVNIWGDVPLINSSDIRFGLNAPRTEAKEVYKFILSDLKIAKILLKEQYPGEERARATKWAAIALLARVYLTLGDWSNAELEASSIINSGFFTPLPMASTAFFKGSKETILQIWNQGGFTSLGGALVPSTANTVPTFSITDSLIMSFDTADERRRSWIKDVSIGSKTYRYPYKYRNRTVTSGTNGEYLIIQRASEMYLVRAEATAQLGKMGDAARDINVVRARANVKPMDSILSKEDCLAIIFKERRKEFFVEGWLRFFDLKRTGQIDHVMKKVKPTWTTEAELFPIPLEEIGRNPSLVQNRGYN